MLVPVRFLLVIFFVAWQGPAFAEPIREVGQAELRKIVTAGGILSLKTAVKAVADSTGAEPIEARAFLADGVVYRMVLKREDGSLFSVIIDATSGRQVPSKSAVGKLVSDAATVRAKGKSATEARPAPESSKADGRGNSAGAGDNRGGGNGNAGQGNGGKGGGAGRPG